MEQTAINETTRNNRVLNRRTWICIAILVVLIPATLYLTYRLGDRYYYIGSVLIIGYICVPVFMKFEGRKPQARELVIMAVLCAIAVAARTVFIMIPMFKPMTALIIIYGISLGPEAGFLIGAMSAFVSNFIFGQGMWTPWQMFAYGLAGFLAGILYRKGWLTKKKVPLAIYGALFVLILMGPLLDTSTIVALTTMVDTDSVLAVYWAGFQANLIHAACTFLTLLIVSKTMFEKLDRIQVKYGLMEGNGGCE